MPDKFDEILEMLHLKEEQNAAATREEAAALQPDANDLLGDMAAQGLVTIGSDELVSLSDAGRGRAREVVRLHRLAERLLVDVLDLSRDTMEQEACTFEHMVSRDVAESICTLLGHPAVCPHGKAIPPGDCCKRASRGVTPLVMPLTDLPCGKDARVLYISTRHHDRLDRLASMGLLPGVELRLHQRRPACVIQLGETTLAMDESIAKDIFVRQK